MSTSQNHRPITLSPSPPSITFLASWRGQLLICTIILILGGIYLVIREPIGQLRRRRRETISRVRGEELVSQERERGGEDLDEKGGLVGTGSGGAGGGGTPRGRERKRDGKKRKGSLLRIGQPAVNGQANGNGNAVGQGIGGGSGNASAVGWSGESSTNGSIESSPAPGFKVGTRGSPRTGGASSSPRTGGTLSSSALTGGVSLPTDANSPARKGKKHSQGQGPQIRLREPTAPSIPTLSQCSSSKAPTVPSPSNPTPSFPPTSHLEPSAEIFTSPSQPHPSTPPNGLSTRHLSPTPSNIPLPDSPLPTISSLRLDSEDDRTDNDDFDTSATDPDLDVKAASKGAGGGGFSIIPEEGYLPPPPALPSASKKKKRKGRNINVQPDSPSYPTRTQMQSLQSPSTPNHDHTHNHHHHHQNQNQDQDQSPQTRPPQNLDQPNPNSSPAPTQSPTIPTTPSSAQRPTHTHKRKSSLTHSRPPQTPLSDLLDDRERTIDALRGELGIAKAEAAKVNEEYEKARLGEDRMKGELERLKRGMWGLEGEGRRREMELQSRLQQLNSLYTTALQRLGALDAMLRELSQSHTQFPPSPNGSIPIGMTIPSPLPPNMMQPHSHSPISNGSPYATHPTLNGLSRGYQSYPSPGMYPTPSPLLHPFSGHLQSNGTGNGVGERRLSISEVSLAGPLTPGAATSLASPYLDIGIGSLPLNHPRIPSPSALPIDPRRLSIESTVMKKKIPALTNGSNTGSDPLPEVSEEHDHDHDSEEPSQGVGVGLGVPIDHVDGRYTGPIAFDATTATHTSSGTTSPSPSLRRQMLLTPAHADLYPTEGDHTHTNGGATFDGEGEGDRGRQGRKDEGGLGNKGNREDGEDEDEDGGEEHQPIFASLAHTPEQVKEMERMRMILERRVRERGGKSQSPARV